MRVAILGLVVLLGLLPSYDSLATPSASEPPTRPTDFADPFVARDEHGYVAFATGAQGRHVQVARSRDLRSWTPPTDALPALPPWAARVDGLTWAPSVLRRGAGWVMYFTTRHAASGFQCIGRARSASSVGPYVDDSSAPFVCRPELCGDIDPSPHVAPDGRAWLLWKSDENAEGCKGRSRIWSQQLENDGLSLIGSPRVLLTTDRDWERPLIEGPSMIHDAGRTYLFYSAAWYEGPGYAIGYATCDGPAGPCTKQTRDGPFLGSAGSTLGPGGQELFVDASGRTWMAYHAWTAPHATYADGGVRSLRLARVRFVAGSPVLAEPDGGTR